MSGVRLRRRGIFGEQPRKRRSRRVWRLTRRNAILYFKREAAPPLRAGLSRTCAGTYTRIGKVLATPFPKSVGLVLIETSLDHFGTCNETHASFWKRDASTRSLTNECTHCRHQSRR